MDSPETGNDLRRHVFDWDDLQIFHAVATTGSMSAAASALGCQQSTVSKRMRQLESRLGSQLIERRAAGVVLTEAGEKALDFVLTMQRSAQQLENQVSGRDRAMEGQVVLRAPDGLATYWLARHIPEFMRIHPTIDLKLVNDQSPSIGDHAAHLSITFVPEKAMDVRAEELGTLHFVPVASRDFFNTYGAPQSLTDVANLRFLTLEQYDKDLNSWGFQANATNSIIKYSFRTDISSVLFETIRYGGGIAMAPTYLAHLYPDELVVLDYEFHQAMRFWLKYQPGGHDIGRVKCVGDWITKLFDRKENLWFRDEFCHPSEFSGITVIKPQQ